MVKIELNFKNKPNTRNLLQVTIEAKLEQKHNDSRFYQEWSNKYTLPENADTSKLKSVLDYDGILHIDAPISEVKEGLTTEIPINHK